MPMRTNRLCCCARRMLAALLCLVLALAVCQVNAYADEAADTGRKTVRVGYVNVPTYEEGGEGEYKYGSGYEYLQKISYITGWKYEYVYGNFSECLQMLENGEIDLFGNVSYTADRAEKIDFSSYPQGKDTYLLYTKADNTELTTGDVQKLNGCRIGVTQNSLQERLLQSWLPQNGIEAEIYYYGGYEPLMAAMDNGDVDAIATPDLAASYEYVPIINLGFSDYYFGVSKSRPDLLSELNEALYQIQSTEVDYNNNLAARYQTQMLNARLRTEDEANWLQEHGNVVRMGYLKYAMPYSGQENGEIAGIMKTVADTLESKLEVSVQTVGYDTFSELMQAAKAGEVDIAGPAYGDFYLAEQNDLVPTSALFSTAPLVVCRPENAQNSTNVIAVNNAGFLNEDAIHVLFPQAELYPCSTLQEAVEAVVKKKADGVLTTSSGLNALNAYRDARQLQSAEVARSVDVCLVASMQNRAVCSLFNKGIMLSSDEISGSVLQNSYTERTVTLMDFVESHAWQIALTVAVIIAVLGSMVYRLAVNKKKLQAALEQAQSASVAKTTFLNHMSHDIRTPMNAIMGFTGIALKQDPPPAVCSCLKKIEDSSEHLLTLLNDVLDISRIESGKVVYQPAPQDITKMTDVVLQIANGFLANRDIQFCVKREAPPTPYVLADAVRIREILVNILSNAFKFTNDGGTITFEETYRPGADQEHFTACYRVSDTGIGMSREFLSHIFDEFAQENSDARTRYNGTGLGMAITKRYVDLMGGTVTVKSEKGRGSEFVVELPLQATREKAQTVQSLPAGKTDLRGVRVLLAEDNDLNAEIATAQLEDAGMQVTRAENGRAAVELFAKALAGSYDIVLMDVMMPVMNGYEATRAIRALPGRPDGEKIPIVALTANAFAEDVQNSMSAGMNAHISKPIVMDELLKTMARLLQ